MNESDNPDELMNSMNQLRLNPNQIQPKDHPSSIQSILRTSDSNSSANPIPSSHPPSSKRSRIISFSDPLDLNASQNCNHHHHQPPARNQSRILRQTPFPRSNVKSDENFDSFIRKRRASEGDDQDEEIHHIDDDEEEQLNGGKQVEISIPSSPTLPKRTKRVRIKSPAPIKVNHLSRRVRNRGVRLGGIRRNSVTSIRSFTFSNDFIRSTSSTSVPSNSIPIIKRSRSRTASSNGRSFLFRSAASMRLAHNSTNSNFDFRFDQAEVGNPKGIEKLMGALSMKTDDDKEKED